jgi:hypothetical protein
MMGEEVGEIEPVQWKETLVKHPNCGELGSLQARSGVVDDVVGEAPLSGGHWLVKRLLWGGRNIAEETPVDDSIGETA